MRTADDLEEFIIAPTDSVLAAAVAIDRNGEGIALVCAPDRKLLGLITDGDIRRALISHFDLNSPIELLLHKTLAELGRSPVTASSQASPSKVLELMNQFRLRHIPVVDESLGRVVGLALLSDLAAQKSHGPVHALIVAGGFGQRLQPLTDNQPKPMLRIGQEPILEILVRQLVSAGIDQITIATHYMAAEIANHFGDGLRFGASIDYLYEETPLGTAGCLANIQTGESNILVVNADILTGVDFNALLAFHEKRGADMTVATKEFDVNLSFGVVRTDGDFIKSVEEKPTYTFQVCAGIYVLVPQVCQYVKKGSPTAMPDVIQLLIELHRPVANYIVSEYWVDVGTQEQYERANRDFGKLGGRQ